MTAYLSYNKEKMERGGQKVDVYIKEGRVYGLQKNRKILKLTLDNY